MNTKPFSISIKRTELLDSLRLVKKLCKPEHGEEAVLSFDGACLHIECGGMGVAPGACGYWPAQVRINAGFLKVISAVPPDGDPVVFSVQDNELRCGTTTTACTVQHVWSRVVDLPMAPTDAQILLLAFKNTPEEIEVSGYGKVVANVTRLLDHCIEKAAKQLKEYPITPEELRHFVYTTIRRKVEEGLV